MTVADWVSVPLGEGELEDETEKVALRLSDTLGLCETESDFVPEVVGLVDRDKLKVSDGVSAGVMVAD